MTISTNVDHTVFIKRFKPTDPRLGRHVKHDSRSRNFQVAAAPLDELKSVRHKRYIPILDQGQVGSCTGNAAVGCIGTGVFWDTLKDREPALLNADAAEKFAVTTYSIATQIDPYPGQYPPNDTGSDGLSVAKALQKYGLISGYQHAMSLEATLTALAKQPVIVGTVWRYDMFRPVNGKINISGTDEGGHEYVLDELDVENKRVWMDNSWTLRWGVEGRAYLTWDDLGALLEADGDCTVFTPINQPAPQPTPPSPQPTPPQPTPTDSHAEFLKDVDNALTKFLTNK